MGRKMKGKRSAPLIVGGPDVDLHLQRPRLGAVAEHVAGHVVKGPKLRELLDLLEVPEVSAGLRILFLQTSRHVNHQPVRRLGPRVFFILF